MQRSAVSASHRVQVEKELESREHHAMALEELTELRERVAFLREDGYNEEADLLDQEAFALEEKLTNGSS